MLSPVLDVQGQFDVFSGAAEFYPGDELKFKFENSTEVNTRWLGIYENFFPTGPLETGGDFYNFFVLNLAPASLTDDADDSSSTSASATATADPTSTASAEPTALSAGWDNPAFPTTPDVAQNDLGIYGTGVVSGYFYNASSLAVLSIPSFTAKDSVRHDFQDAVVEFLEKAKAAGMKKVLIDLQQNVGGDVFAAYDAFRRFFPTVDAFTGSRMRAHPAGNVMGNTITGYFDNNVTTESYDYWVLAGNEWVATDRPNAYTGTNFTSWPQFFGPNPDRGDTFTTPARYNLSSDIFDQSATHDASFVLAPTGGAPPYVAEDVVILTDGLCDSACALFVEAMHHEAGGRVVTVGGRPSTGPMQGVAGSRGARLYRWQTLDTHIQYAQQILQAEESPQATFLPNRTMQTQFYVAEGKVNLRDQVRRGAETLPLQFAYEAADCRIFYTPQTVYNQSNLWQYAADAIWTTPSKCVAGSTGLATTGGNATDFNSVPAAASSAAPKSNAFNPTPPNRPATAAELLYYASAGGDGFSDAAFTPQRGARSAPPNKACSKDADCGPNGACASVTVCQGNGKTGPAKRCVAKCVANFTPCANGQDCQLQKNGVLTQVGNQKLQSGFCPLTQDQQQCGGGRGAAVKVGPAPPAKLRRRSERGL